MTPLVVFVSVPFYSVQLAGEAIYIMYGHGDPICTSAMLMDIRMPMTFLDPLQHQWPSISLHKAVSLGLSNNTVMEHKIALLRSRTQSRRN